MALQEPDVNNPRCQPGVKGHPMLFSSAGAEDEEYPIELIVRILV